MPTLLCAGQVLCEPVYYASAYLPFLIAVVIPITLFISGRRKQAYISAIALVASGAVSEGLKYVFNMPRPVAAIALSPSFPSTHSSISFSLARILKTDKTLFILGLVFAAFVSFGRVYTGFHTWQDVIVGGGLGYIISEVIIRESSLLVHGKKRLRKMKKKSQIFHK